MRAQGLVAAAIVTALFPGAARAASDGPPVISVTGEASVTARPGLARIDAGVASVGKTAREAIAANSAAMAKVLAAIKGAGFEERDVRTSQLSLQPQYAERPAAAAPITSYRASNRLSLTLHDVGRLADTVDALVAAGVNEIDDIGFAAEDASQLLDAARKEAFRDARRKAEIYASAAGIGLGAPLRIEETGATPAATRDWAMPSAAPIAPGVETRHVSVSVSFAITQ